VSAIAADLFPSRPRRWKWLVPVVIGLIMGMGLFVSKTKAPSGGGGGELVGAGCADTPDATLANGASATVASGIAAASTGDCIQLPASCTATWTSQVSLSKAITIDFNQCTITRSISGNTEILNIDPPTGLSSLTRITNGNFVDNGGASGFNAAYMTITAAVDSRFRIDHNTFGPADDVTHIRAFHDDSVVGLIDNNTFSIDTNAEIIHNEGYGSGDAAGWGYTVVPGSEDAITIEDNVFESSMTVSFGGNSAVQNYYGSRTVFRYNEAHGAQFDNHGTGGNIGGRWWECYENDFYAHLDMDKVFQMRAGTGVIFDNRLHNESGAAGSRAIVLWEEDSGTYPLLYQIGRGKDQESDPAYISGNTVINDGGGTDGFAISEYDGNLGDECDDCIDLGRDYFLSARPGYTPGDYPNSLQYVAQ
jgi:hypothetical protein